MKTGLEMVIQELADQDDGMNSEDDKWVNGELAMAAVSYLIRGRSLLRQAIPMYWPWSIVKWNPTPNDHRIELAKAASLAIAEINRLNRKEIKNAKANAGKEQLREGADEAPRPGGGG